MNEYINTERQNYEAIPLAVFLFSEFFPSSHSYLERHSFLTQPGTKLKLIYKESALGD